MKFNMGCGLNKKTGYVNVDKFSQASPDLLLDLETFPWPIDSNSASEIMFNHSLEHMGHDPNVFLEIIKETYRVSKPDALIYVNAPHPRHNDFITDPTHVRAITPDLFAMFDLELNKQWAAASYSNTPLAIYTGTNFKIVKYQMGLESRYVEQYNSGLLSQATLDTMIAEMNNIVKEFRIVLRVIK